MSESIRLEVEGAVATITLHRPERRNALDVEAMRSLRRTLETVAGDPTVRAVRITGAGGSFSAGGDVATMDEYRARGELPRLFHDLTGEMAHGIREIVSMPKPVLATLPGVAAGGGLSLALACDWRIASESALLVPAFSRLGAVPDGGLTYFLPHYLGIGLAQELFFSDARVTAGRARELGLVHEVVPGSALDERGRARALELAQGSTEGWAWVKRLVAASFHQGLDAQLALERIGAVEAARGPDLVEGIRAFSEKRAPRFGPKP